MRTTRPEDDLPARESSLYRTFSILLIEATSLPFCDQCGKPISSDAMFCPDCGRKVQTRTPPPASSRPAPPPAPETAPHTVITIMESKSPGIAALLGLLIGIGVFGIGHIYVGRIRRGIVLLVVSLAIHVPLVMAAVLLIPSLFLSRETFGALFIGIVVLGLVNLGLWIWQGYDAYKLAKQFNEHVRQYGKVPW